MTIQATIEGECIPNHVDVEGDHNTINPLVEGEPSGSNHDISNDQNNDFHDVTTNISIAREVMDAKVVFEHAPLDIAPAYPSTN